MELRRIEAGMEFGEYLNGLNDPKLSGYPPGTEPFQNVYYIYENGERMGFVDLHYLPSWEEAVIRLVYIENMFRGRFDVMAFLPLLEDKAKKLGIKILSKNYSGRIDRLMDAGWEVVRTTYLLRKKL